MCTGCELLLITVATLILGALTKTRSWDALEMWSGP